MSAAVTTALVALTVCGDCAVRIYDAQPGNVRPSAIPGVALGKLCEAHHDPMAPQATGILEMTPETRERVLEDQARALAAVRSNVTPGPWGALGTPGTALEGPPASLGPLTEITTRLVVSWTAVDKGANADQVTVQYAAVIARMILAETGGL